MSILSKISNVVEETGWPLKIKNYVKTKSIQAYRIEYYEKSLPEVTPPGEDIPWSLNVKYDVNICKKLGFDPCEYNLKSRKHFDAPTFNNADESIESYSRFLTSSWSFAFIYDENIDHTEYINHMKFEFGRACERTFGKRDIDIFIVEPPVGKCTTWIVKDYVRITVK